MKNVVDVVVEQCDPNQLFFLEDSPRTVSYSPEPIVDTPPVQHISIKDKILSQIKVFKK